MRLLWIQLEFEGLVIDVHLQEWMQLVRFHESTFRSFNFLILYSVRNSRLVGREFASLALVLLSRVQGDWGVWSLSVTSTGGLQGCIGSRGCYRGRRSLLGKRVLDQARSI